MDLRRHVTAGRLSEMVGEDGLETDKVIRTMGWRRVAEAELPLLKPQTRQILQAYADGVNAYIDRAGHDRRNEPRVHRPRPEGTRTTASSSGPPPTRLAWLKAMAWDLRGDYDGELTRARLAGRITDGQIADLYPPYPIDEHRADPLHRRTGSRGSPTVPASGGLRLDGRRRGAPRRPRAPGRAPPRRAPAGARRPDASTGVRRGRAAVPPIPAAARPGATASGPTPGSSARTSRPRASRSSPTTRTSASGSRASGTRSGLHCRERRATPARSTSPASPSPASRASSSATTTGSPGASPTSGPDVTDFYLEQVDGRHLPARRRATSRCRAAPRRSRSPAATTSTLTVRSTVHGPLLSDVVGPRRPGRRQRAGQRQAARTRQLRRLPGLDRARAERRPPTRSSLRPRPELRRLPRRGAGLRRPGPEPRLRRRRRPHRLPGARADPDPARSSRERAPGLLAGQGLGVDVGLAGLRPLRRDALCPRPARGLHRHGQPGGHRRADRPFLTSEWDYGYRAQRIRDLIEAEGHGLARGHGADAARHPQRLRAPARRRFLLGVPSTTRSPGRPAASSAHWDYTNPADNSDEGAAAAYYNAVWSNLVQLTFNDELPSDLQASGRVRRHGVDLGPPGQAATASGGTTGSTPASRRGATRSSGRPSSTHVST